MSHFWREARAEAEYNSGDVNNRIGATPSEATARKQMRLTWVYRQLFCLAMRKNYYIKQ